VIWSDPEIQKIASEYVCVIEEPFFLFPPDWMKNPPNPASTKLFKTYAANSPAGTFPPKTSTHQGLYCMTADGTYLSGKFARQNLKTARKNLSDGLKNWQKITTAQNLQPKSVPTNPLAIYGGDDFKKGGLKLQLTYRDLPRGKVQRPGNALFPNPFNLGWYDFTPADARAFLTDSTEKVAIPDSIFQKLVLTQIKDAVRGQNRDWEKGALQEGQLFTQLISTKEHTKTYQLTGSAKISADSRSFSPSFHGIASFDEDTGEFTDFRLIASGQRSGQSQFNGRSTDLGPAPMAIALTLFQP